MARFAKGRFWRDFLSATFFHQTGFSLVRFANFSSLRDVVFAMLFAAAPPNP
jgi:hypothetical protein